MKRFRRPAKSQELLLRRFEDAGWPPRLENPFNGSSTVAAADRLKETVRRLNGGQLEARLRFERDGTGCGVLWRPRSAD